MAISRSNTGESQVIQSSTDSELRKVSRLANPRVDNVTYQPASQDKTQASPPDLPQEPAKPIFIARDFAYQPPPKLLPFTVDERWVLKSNLPDNPVPGMRERFAEEWERTHAHLYRLRGNRADPPNAIQKTWGGRSKSEDERLMRQAQDELNQRIQQRERRKLNAQALGFTLTESDLGVPPPILSQEDIDREEESRMQMYLKARDAEILAAGHPPLIRTPHNSPPLPRSRGRSTATPPRQTSETYSKRKFDAPDSECDDSEKAVARVRKRQDRRNAGTVHEQVPGPSSPPRYFLRQRNTNGTANHSPTSPKGKGKGKGKGEAEDQ